MSTEHAAVRAQLLDLPDTNPDRMAVIWVPPYTQWTSELELPNARRIAPVNPVALF